MTRASIAMLACVLAACAPARIVSPLMRAPLPPAPEEAFRTTPPPLTPVNEITDSVRMTTLPNGIRVVLIERHGYPIVALHLVIDRGSVDLDDAGGRKVDEVTKLFARGGDEATFERLNEACAVAGASWTTGSDRDSSWIAARGSKNAFDVALDVLASLSIAPRLQGSEYGRVAAVLQKDVEWKLASLASATRTILFGEEPYGFRPAPDPIAMEEAQAIHDRLFQPAHATIVIAGDVTPAQVDASVARAFGGWSSKGPATVHNDVPPPFRTGPRVSVQSRRNLTHRLAAVFARGPEARSKDIEAFELATKVLGGDTGSPLFGHLREELGATYAPQAAAVEMRTASYLTIFASFDSDRAVEGIRDVVHAVEDLRSGRVKDEDIALGRETLLAGFRQEMSTVAGAAAMYARSIARGQDPSELASRPARIAQLRREDLERVAKTWLAPEALHVVFMGEDRWLDVSPLGMGGVTKL